jgi:hypothetical protein
MNQGAAWPTLSVTARNRISDPRKKMHDPAVAQRMGFADGLVPGTVLYGYLLRPILARFGRDWLSGVVCDLDLPRPVTDGEALTIRIQPADGAMPRALRAAAVRDDGKPVATLATTAPAPFPKPDPRYRLPSGAPPDHSRPLERDMLVAQNPFAAMVWTPSPKEQAGFCAEVEESLPLFHDEAPVAVHPALIVRKANDTLVHQFRADFSIHVASRIVHHAPLLVGKPVEIRAVPEELWERNGHAYVRLYVAMLTGGRLAVELNHTLIYRPRGS